jgi:hypothetical protein
MKLEKPSITAVFAGIGVVLTSAAVLLSAIFKV